LLPDEDRPDSAVVVLNESAWRRYLAADPAVIGSTLLFDGSPYAVVGVAA
jgi:hypothetical protein